MKVLGAFVLGVVTGAVVLTALQRGTSGDRTEVTVYSVVCGRSVEDSGRSCKGPVTSVNDPLVFRADSAANRVVYINAVTGILVPLKDCLVFDADTWYCEGPGALSRMHNGAYSSPIPDSRTIQVPVWKWLYFKASLWMAGSR